MPTYWNKIKVHIKRLNKTATVMDARFREPAADPNYNTSEAPDDEDPEVFYAQMHFDKQEKRDRQRAGNVPETAGRLVYGLDVAPLVQGDRITAYASLDADGNEVMTDCDYAIIGGPERKGHLRGAARIVRSPFVEYERFVAR